MAFGFIKKVFSFGRKEVVEEKPDETAPLPPLNFDALKPTEEAAPDLSIPLAGREAAQQPGGVGEAARDLETPSRAGTTFPLAGGEASGPIQPTQEIQPEPAPETEPSPPPEQPVTPEQEPETPPKQPEEVPPEPIRPEPAQPEPAPEVPPAHAPQPEKPEIPAPAPEVPKPPAEVPLALPQEEPEPQPVKIPAEPEPVPAEVPVGTKPQAAPPVPLPLEERVAAKQPGGVGEAARDIETTSPVETTPSGPSSHLPLKGGEKPAPGKVTVSKKVEQKAKPAATPEPVQPRKSWFQRMRDGLARSSRELTSNIAGVFTKRKLDEDTLQDLEDILIRADLGVETALRVTDSLASSRYGKTISDEEVRTVMAQEIGKVLAPVALPLELDLSHKPHVVLVVGVNGTGKTTTIGKLAAKLSDGGLSVMLAAGDTFRAAAIEQLKIWGERTNSPVVASKLGADAAGLAYDAFERAKEAGSDVLIIDTAGRLQNKAELMAELEKIVRVLGKLDPEAPHTVLQTVDATTGQNALNQVEIFRNIAGVNGLVMTKLDGTARGGILVAIAAKHKLPVYFIGVGEQVDDLEPFSANEFARAIAGVA
jgi:fused signal recognition particle receptor